MLGHIVTFPEWFNHFLKHDEVARVINIVIGQRTLPLVYYLYLNVLLDSTQKLSISITTICLYSLIYDQFKYVNQ